MTLMGGQAAFVQKLDRLLWQPPVFHVGGYGHEIHEMTEMAVVPFGQYAQSNQPIHQVLGHYSAAGCPSRLQYWTRRVLDHLYTPDSFPGDEDNGEMAAWYVLGALGLFPHCPGRPTYVFGSPLFPEVIISPPNGKQITLHAPATSQDAIYASRITFNGHVQDHLWISHEDLTRGGHLEFSMTKRPISRRLALADLPPSWSPYHEMAAETELMPIAICINCGGKAAGTFVGDCFVAGGDSSTLETGHTASDMPPTIPAEVSSSERRGTFTYRIPLPMLPGVQSYTVRLYFATGAETLARSLDVSINGIKRLSGFNSATEIGRDGLALKEYYDVLPNLEGEVVIAFSPSLGASPDACGVSGIEIQSSETTKEKTNK